MSETAYARRLRHRESRGRWLRPGTKYRYQARPLAWYDAADAGCWRSSELGRTIQAVLQDAIQKMGYAAADVATQLSRAFLPSTQPRWLPDDLSRIDTRPVVLTEEEFEQAQRDGFAWPIQDEHETRPPTPRGPICPECKAGKHRNCDGTAWDTDRDQRTDCGCFLTSPIEHGS